MSGNFTAAQTAQNALITSDLAGPVSTTATTTSKASTTGGLQTKTTLIEIGTAVPVKAGAGRVSLRAGVVVVVGSLVALMI